MTADKFCFFLKLETGCVVLGVITFMVALAKLVISTVCSINDEICELSIRNTFHHAQAIRQLSKGLQTVLLVFVVTLSLMWLAASALLVVGVRKKRLNFVMTYFLFGILMSIVYLLSGILEAISGLWLPSLLTLGFTMAYMKCLFSVYIAYDKMRQEKEKDDTEQLIEDDSSNNY